jgi:hypothetical protein
MFEKVTGLSSYPDYLSKDVEGELLKVYANGEINYKLKGVHAKVSVIWNYEAPAGTGDTHYSIMRGTKCDLVIRQGEAEGYKPTLYLEFHEDLDNIEYQNLTKLFYRDLSAIFPGISFAADEAQKKVWTVNIPDRFKVGHEAHFGQVTEKYLGYLKSGKLPEWEVPNMIVKYFTTTEGMKKAME